MNYYLDEIQDDATKKVCSKNAGSKASNDAACIFAELGMRRVELYVDDSERTKTKGFKKLIDHLNAVRSLKASVSEARSGDTVFFQFPIRAHSVFASKVFRRLERKGIRIVFLVHDLETLRRKKTERSWGAKIRIQAEEVMALRACYRIIVHNEVMKKYLEDSGISAEKMISLQIFDYLVPERASWRQERFQKDGGVIIAGNLEKKKAGYLGELPENVSWNLYGAGYEDTAQTHIAYKGSFSPDELTDRLEGSFGLVWDGSSAETCSGVYGEYMRINNPHKTSLYLAAGLPVIIWSKAALAPFIVENGLGITVSSLYEIKNKIDALSPRDYEKMKANARVIGERLRDGYYLRSAIGKI